MIELEDDGSEQPHEVAVDKVFLTTDERWPTHRVQIASYDEESDSVVATTIDWYGRPLRGHRFVYPARHFRWGDVWKPDDTGLPVAMMMVDGKLVDRAEYEEEARRAREEAADDPDREGEQAGA